MYKLLIVDDEASLCQNIRSKIERLAFPQIEEIRVCYSGEEALALCASFKPQIVITDIKMEKMNGIELARALFRRLFPVKFIFLSGHDDFTYVKQAFMAGASDYLLKPLLTDQLRDVLQKTIASLNSPDRGGSDTRTELFQTAQALPILLHLQSDPLTTRKALNRLSGLQAPWFCCCMLGSLAPVSEQVLVNTINLLYDTWDTANLREILCAAVSYDRIAILVNAQKRNRDALSAALQDFLAQLQKLNICMGGALSPVGRFAEIPALLRQAQDNLLVMLDHTGPFLSQEQIDFAALPLPRHLAYLKTLFDIAAVSRTILFEKLDAFLSGMSGIELCQFYLTLAEELGYIRRKNKAASRGAAAAFPSVFSFYSRQELLLAIYDRLEQSLELLTNEMASIPSTVELVKRYIDAHYTEHINLHSLSNQFSVSYAHLSKLLREHLNMPFSEYIISLRMSKACELLQASERPVSEIAEQVGYDNAFNFTRAFKHLYGVSPSRYRATGAPGAV